MRDTDCCPPEGQARRHSLTINFSGFNTFKVGYTRHRSTSPIVAPKHLRARYRAHSKARYWARG